MGKDAVDVDEPGPEADPQLTAHAPKLRHDSSVTGARARALALLLSTGKWELVKPPRPPRGVAHLEPVDQDLIRNMYLVLGGDPGSLDRIHPANFDFAVNTPDGLLLIELDEEQHFNRYRATTLTLTEHLQLPWTAPYLDYSDDDEHRLLPFWSNGNRWSNPSAARFFGEPSPPGDFTGNGAPRWRQRAFYDSVKDAHPNRRLARLSIYDTVEDRTLDELLTHPHPSTTPAIKQLLNSRTHTA